MITFRNAVGFLQTIADKHQGIRSFHSGFLDEVDISKLGVKDYPILYAEPSTTTVNKGTMTYSFNLYVLSVISDVITESSTNTFNSNQRTGRLDTLSSNLQILHDVINEFHQNLYSTSWVDDEVVLQLPISCEPFTARFDNTLSGWSAPLVIEVNNTNNLCIVPITANT